MGTTAYKKYLQSKNTFENILTGINKEEVDYFLHKVSVEGSCQN
jgi:hypothetical protein